MLKNYEYEIFDCPEIDDVQKLLDTPNLRGLNVTIPYKEKILPFLDELSDEAQKIGAVNTILLKNGKKIGYNTDAFGFEKSLLLVKKDFHQNALILGNGGAAKAVSYVLDKLKIPFKIVARKSELNFENLSPEMVKYHQIIVQCTPVGTFPNVEDCLDFPFDAITDQHLVIDLVYNPTYSQFIKNAANKGAKTLNGLFMLEQQAEKAWEIWNF